jgi:hypothetical protein
LRIAAPEKKTRKPKNKFRQAVLDVAYEKDPKWFKGKSPMLAELPEAV